MSVATADEIRSELAECWCTSAYHSGLGQNILLTDGAFLMAELCGAFWLLDIIASYQRKPKLKKIDFQVWRLTIDTTTGAGMVTCTDGNNKKLAEKELDYTDFPLPEGITLWKEGDVILLPSEH
jgi:hypothetical protein